MPFELDTFEEMVSQANAEVRRINPDIDPTVFASFTVPYNVSAAALSYSVQQTVGDLKDQLFPQTAEGEFLEDWAGYEDLERKPASSSSGFISIEGTLGVTIPALSEFTSASEITFQSQAVSTVQNVSQVIASLDRIGTTVTATMTDDHSLASGLELTIIGAVETEYNGVFTIVVIARNKFTYEITTTPSTPATGTINYTATFASVDLKSVETGLQANLEGGAVLTASPAITNLDTTGFAQFDGMSGGSEIESDAELRARTILSRSIIEGVFTPDQIRLAGLSIAGNTRVFVIRPELSVSQTNIVVQQSIVSINRSGTTASVVTTGNHQLVSNQQVTISGAVEIDYNGLFFITVTGDTTFEYQVAGSPTTPATGTIILLSCVFTDPEAGFIPAPGQVAVYVLRDNDANIIPTQTILDQTKTAIINDGSLPANSSEIDVFVLAPEPVETDFIFTSIFPDTPTMRTAIDDSLTAFFEDNIQFETNVTEASYLGAIQNTQDLQTGDLLISFSLSAPSGDIIISNGQIAVKGDVTFP